jgi:hypothetical protein
MSYLLRTNENYRVCYGEPKKHFVITGNGSYFCAEEFQKMVDDEREVECQALMDSENFPLDSWADVDQNNSGLVIIDSVAEYLLDGDALDVDTWIELGLVT